MKTGKTIWISIFLMAFLCGGAYAEKGVKLGYVDLSRLFDEYYKTKDYDKVLEAEHSDVEKERNVKLDKIRDAQGKLGALAEAKKKESEQDIEKMKNEIMEFDRQKNEDLTKKRNEKIREILLEIEKVASDYAAKENYSMIFNDRVLIFGDKSLDLTEDILKILNGDKADDNADNKVENEVEKKAEKKVEKKAEKKAEKKVEKK